MNQLLSNLQITV